MSEPAKLPDIVAQLTGGITEMTINLAWGWDVEAVKNLLGNACLLQSGSRDVMSNIDSTLTLLALGVEKTLKLALGCCHSRDHGGEWPTHLQKSYGHRSAAMQTTLLSKATKAAAHTSHEFEILALVQTIQSDEVWQVMILALDVYGTGGRFHYLDVLAQNPKRTKLGGPRESWLAVLWSALQPAEALSETTPNDEEWDGLVNRVIVGAILTWWNAIARLGHLGAFGELGTELGSRLQPSPP